MTIHAAPRLLAAYKTFAKVTSIIAVLVGCLVLLGWLFDSPTLKSILPGMVTMKPNTALAFVLSGLLLWFLPAPPAPAPGQAAHAALVLRQRRLVQAGAGLVALLGVLTLSEDLFGWDLGIDTLLFGEPPGAPGTSAPGRMSPMTAVNFVMLGIALLLLTLESQRDAWLPQGLALTTAGVGLLGTLGYAYHLPTLYAIAPSTPMAAHTALTFLVLACGILCALPDRALMAILTSESVGGAMARRLLPAAAIVPAVLGWLSLHGARLSLYSAVFGMALFALVHIAIFAVLIWWSAASLLRMDAERQRAEAELQEFNQELEQRVAARTVQLEDAMRELEAFTYSISHDLRAPLRAIEGFSDILLTEHAPQLTPEVQDLLHLVREHTQGMGQLINALLDFSRLSRQPLTKQPVAPADLIRAALEELRSAQEGRQVQMIIGDLPGCQADPALLKQVWVNLLANALKFTRRRAVAVLEIGCRDSDERPGERVYFVKDNGVGFDMQQAERLFGVFQRLHRAEEYEGTGVGLAIVQRIIHRHSGRVWAEAVVNQGATFSFTLGNGVDRDGPG